MLQVVTFPEKRMFLGHPHFESHTPETTSSLYQIAKAVIFPQRLLLVTGIGFEADA